MKISSLAVLTATAWKAQGFSVIPQSKIRIDTSLRSARKEENACDSRRYFLWSGFMTTAALGLPWPAHAATSPDYKAVSADIVELIRKTPDWGPTFVRLAWHSSGKSCWPLAFDKTPCVSF
jgi:hypothetical protein